MSVSNNANVGIDNNADNAGLAGDLIWGIAEIGAELNLTPRQVFHQLKTGRLPARKQAGKWVASRSGLRRYFASILAGEVA
jgi:hypothetical protein